MAKTKKKSSGPSMMERTRMAREYINRVPMSRDHAEDMELHAFMSIFHPEVPVQKVREMSWDRKNYRR